jgi:hypothetical protein
MASEAMRHTHELPFSRTVEFVFRLGYRALRLGGPPRPDSFPEIIVSRKTGLVCAAIPLCATRTLKGFFLRNPNVDFAAELLRDTVPNVLRSERWRGTPLLFSVVRNPWSRAVTCYDKMIRGANIKRTFIGYRGIAVIAGHDGLSTKMSFDEFVDWLCGERGRDAVANRHWMSQYRFLSLPEMGSQYTKILRLESLERDLNEILSGLGLSYQAVEKTNSSATTAAGRLYATTREYYTPRTINAIGDRYSEDAKLFGYDSP